MKSRSVKYLYFISAMIFFVGCSPISESENRPVLAYKKNQINPKYPGVKLLSKTELTHFYPSNMKREGVEGWGLVCFDLDSDGFAINIKPMEYNPNVEFVYAAVEHVKSAKFIPVRYDETNEKLVEVDLEIQDYCAYIDFRLGDKPDKRLKG